MGTLFVVATPIGNLQDITLRALSTLEDVSIIAAEDTRSAQRLLHAHGLWPLPKGKRILSYFQGNEAQRTAELVALLLQGERVALLSEAGTPGISDPGHRLIAKAIAHQIRVEVIPGPCAAIHGLLGSGIDPSRFFFVGFPPRKEQERHYLFASLATVRATLILYEAPGRLAHTLLELSTSLGVSRNACVCRELTKVHEEFRRGTIQELAAYYAEHTPLGEITLILEGAGEDQAHHISEMDEEIKQRLQAGEHPKDISLVMSLRFGVSKRKVYQQIISLGPPGLAES